MTIVGTHAEVATVRVPDDAAHRTIHVVLAVTDSGQPLLTRYRRVLITAGKADGTPASQERP